MMQSNVQAESTMVVAKGREGFVHGVCTLIVVAVAVGSAIVRPVGHLRIQHVLVEGEPPGPGVFSQCLTPRNLRRSDA